MKFDIITNLPCVDTTTSTSTTTTATTVTTTTTTETTTSTSTTLQCIPQDLQKVAPDIFSGTVSSFGSFPSGYYQVAYVFGAMRYSGGAQWEVNDSVDHGFRIAHSGGGTIVEGPHNGYTGFDNQADVEQFNSGTVVSFFHTGGTIGMFLIDSPYGDNVAGQPTPTFLLRRICPS